MFMHRHPRGERPHLPPTVARFTGLTTGGVAGRLYISPHTVNTYLRYVFAKRGVLDGLRLPLWCMIRSSDVFVAGRQHGWPRAVS